MAKYVYLTLFVVACFVASIKADVPSNCSNPVAEFLGIPLLETPASRPSGADLCKRITGDVCCSAATFNLIEAAFKEYRSEIDAVYASLKQLQNPKFPSFNDLFKSIGGCKDSLFTAYDLTCNDVEKLYNRIIKAFSEFYNDLATNVATCLQGILQFYAGVICFLCDAMWGNYLSVDAEGNYVFTMATAVCDDVADACLPLYNGVQQLYEEIVQAASDLGTLGQSAFADLGTGIGDLCNNDCRHFICYIMISGYDAQFSNPLASDSTGSMDSGTTGREEIPEFYRAMARATADAFQPARDLLERHHNAVGKLSRTIRDAKETVSVYTKNGYAATDVGKDSSLDTSVAGADNGSSSSAAQIVASIFALFAFLALLF